MTLEDWLAIEIYQQGFQLFKQYGIDFRGLLHKRLNKQIFDIFATEAKPFSDNPVLLQACVAHLANKLYHGGHLTFFKMLLASEVQNIRTLYA